MRMYKEPSYAKQRLLETIVRVNGKAVVVKDISSVGVLYKELVTGATNSCTYNELDINPVPLGNYNGYISCLYITRLPMREDWKQGARYNNLRDSYGNSIDFNWTSLGRTIEGIYPSISDCLNRIKKGKASSIAFSRNFAINSEYSLLYKMNWTVGKVEGVDKYSLFDKFLYLKEIATEEIGFENSL